jgi:hypothetical protein
MPPKRGGGARHGGGRGGGAPAAGAGAAAAGGTPLTTESLKALFAEQNKQIDAKIKAIADDVKSVKSAKSNPGNRNSNVQSPARGILRPPPSSGDGEKESSDSDASSSSSSSSSSKSSKKSRKDRVRGITTKGMSREKIIKAKVRALVDVDAEDVYWVPERLSEWISAPGDVEESRTRAASLLAVHDRALDRASAAQMGSFFYESPFIRPMFKALTDTSQTPESRIENALALVGCRQVTQAIAARSGYRKAVKYWQKRTILSMADPQARKALASVKNKKWGGKSKRAGGKKTA